jgi:AcrR family transcriptional regulator
VPEIPAPSDRPPLRRDAERNRRRILAAARRLIAERGLGVGYEEIAREADVGVGTVYRRFPTRDGLYYELFYNRVNAVVAILEEALAIADPWQGLCRFMELDFELQSSDRGLREFMLGRADSTELGRRSRERIQPLVTELVERAQAAGRLRADVGQSDIAIILAMLGGLMDASIDVEPELWRRYLAMVLGGIRRGDRHDEIPGKPPEQTELERILAGWIPPRRGQSYPQASW